MVNAIDHAGGLRQQLDFVPVLNLAGGQHGLLSVHNIQASLLQGVEHRGFGVIHTNRHALHARVFDQACNLFSVFFHQAKAGRDRSSHADNTCTTVVWNQPIRMFFVVHCSRPKVPNIGRVITCQQTEAAHLVAFPFADLGGGHIADVVHIKQQQRAAVGILERLTRAAQTVAAQTVVIYPFFKIN